MKSNLKRHLFYLFAYAISAVILTVLGNSVLATLCCAIFGEDAGLVATVIVMRIFLPIITMIMIYFYTKNNTEQRREYIKMMDGKQYDVKQDLDALLHSKRVWSDVILLSVVIIIYWLFHIAFPFVLAYIPAFAVFFFWLNIHLHKHWLKKSREMKS